MGIEKNIKVPIESEYAGYLKCLSYIAGPSPQIYITKKKGKTKMLMTASPFNNVF